MIPKNDPHSWHTNTRLSTNHPVCPPITYGGWGEYDPKERPILLTHEYARCLKRCKAARYPYRCHHHECTYTTHTATGTAGKATPRTHRWRTHGTCAAP